MTNNKEKTSPLEEICKPMVTNRQELVKIALKCCEKGYITYWDYAEIAVKNNPSHLLF